MGLQSKLPDSQPISGEMKVVEEVNYEIIVEWYDDWTVNVKLQLAPHTDFPSIVPELTDNCALCDSEEEASTVSDLPVQYQQYIDDIVRILSEKYNLSEESDERTCIQCDRPRGGTLVFTTMLR